MASQVTVEDAKSRLTKLYAINDATLVRSHDGKRRTGAQIPSTFQAGDEVIVNAIDGKNASLVRSAYCSFR